MSQRLPIPGGDDNTWGDILNAYLEIAHNADGTLQASALSSAGGELTSNKGKASGYASLDGSGNVPASQLNNAPTAADATAISKGLVQLAGDLNGTAASPTVPGLASKVSSIAAADGTITVAGTSTNPILKVGSISETQVTNLSSDLAAAEKTANKAQPNGYASLDGTGNVPASQLGNASAAGVVNPPADQTGLSSSVFYRGGQLKVAYEVLNAVEAGYLNPTSTADQSTGLQNFINAVQAANGGPGFGYIPAARNANASYRMGNNSVTLANSNHACHIFGDDAGNWQGAVYLGGTILEWETDTTSAPETVAGLTIGNGNRVSGLSFKEPNVYDYPTGHYGIRPSALAGVSVQGGSLDHCVFQHWGAAILVGAPGASADHLNIDHIGAIYCGFGLYLPTGATTHGDIHFNHLYISAYLAAVGTGTATGYAGGTFADSGLYGPYGFMRFDDGQASGTVLFLGAMDFHGTNVEAPGHGGIYDELYLSGTTYGQVIDNNFGLGMFGAPGASWGRTWTATCTITNISGNQITIEDPYGGFVFRNAMVATGTGWSNQTVTAISGTWPQPKNGTYTLTMSSAPSGSPTSVTLTMPVLATLVAGTIGNNHFGGSVGGANNGGSGPVPFMMCNNASNNTTHEGDNPYITAQNAGFVVNAGGAIVLQGNRWGKANGGGTLLTTMEVAFAVSVSQYDLVEQVPTSSNTRVAVQPASGAGKPIGIAQQARAAFNAVDIVQSAWKITVNNKSASSIADKALLKVDTANPGGVTTAASWNDGQIIGVAIGAINATSTGTAQIFCGN